MSSLILRTAARALAPLLLLFSVFLMIAGHDQPGGGFVGGLIAASAFSLHALAYDVGDARRLLRLDPHTLIAGGLVVAALAAIGPMFIGLPLLTGVWTELRIGVFGMLPIGSPLVFDLGVYLLVTGVALLMILTLAEE